MVGRKLLYPKNILVPVTLAMWERINAAAPRGKRLDLIRSAIEVELAKREAATASAPPLGE